MKNDKKFTQSRKDAKERTINADDADQTHPKPCMQGFPLPIFIGREWANAVRPGWVPELSVTGSWMLDSGYL